MNQDINNVIGINILSSRIDYKLILIKRVSTFLDKLINTRKFACNWAQAIMANKPSI
jgi:hypothetical protein